MSCPEIRARLMLADFDELHPDGELGRHLSTCPGCSADLMKIRIGTAAAADTLNSWSSNLETRQLVEQIQLDQASTRSRWERWWSIAGTAAIVAASLLLYVAKAERMASLRAGLGFPDSPAIRTIMLRCISSEIAAEIGASILAPTRGSSVRIRDGLPAVVLAGDPLRVADAEIAIREADGTLDPKHPRACPATPTPSPR